MTDQTSLRHHPHPPHRHLDLPVLRRHVRHHPHRRPGRALAAHPPMHHRKEALMCTRTDHDGACEDCARTDEWVDLTPMTTERTASMTDEAARFTERHPIGTPVRYWPGLRKGEGRASTIRSRAWAMDSGHVVVKVDGYPGGISLTHIEVAPAHQEPQTTTMPPMRGDGGEKR